MKSVFKILEHERSKSIISHSEEVKFFNSHKYLLKSDNLFSIYSEANNIFSIIQANIIIKSIINKEYLDDIISEEYLKNDNSNLKVIKNKIKERSLDLPCIKYKKYKVFVPFFNKITNIIYSIDNEKMNNDPYLGLKKKFSPFIVDPFETYNIELYDSTFTHLIKVDEDTTSVAFYDYNLSCIFIVNKQGSLDNIIYLFDKRIKNKDSSGIIERIKPIIKSYYENNLNDFVYNLYKNGFISYYVFNKICKEKNL